MTDDRQMITSADLKSGQSKVVIYRSPNCSVIVPDQAWDMCGDLSKLPEKLQEQLRHYSKNGFSKSQGVIDSSALFSGKVQSDIKEKGYSIDTVKVDFWEEYDRHGKRITWDSTK